MRVKIGDPAFLYAVIRGVHLAFCKAFAHAMPAAHSTLAGGDQEHAIRVTLDQPGDGLLRMLGERILG